MYETFVLGPFIPVEFPHIIPHSYTSSEDCLGMNRLHIADISPTLLLVFLHLLVSLLSSLHHPTGTVPVEASWASWAYFLSISKGHADLNL